MERRILLCSDLDRTVLPNGVETESPTARPLFSVLASRPEVSLAYVSGRSHELILESMENYDIPMPDYTISDVGATIHENSKGVWQPWKAWRDEIASDWNDWSPPQLALMFSDIQALTLQEEEKQSSCKLSYYYPTEIDKHVLQRMMMERLLSQGVRATLVFSVDDNTGVGLLDVLPARASKLHAIRFLIRRGEYDESQVLFAGDSGNDLSVLTSGLQAVLVRNASREVKKEAIDTAMASGVRHQLYLAEGGFMGMNGRYSAGVLEGVVHFFKDAGVWLEEMVRDDRLRIDLTGDSE